MQRYSNFEESASITEKELVVDKAVTQLALVQEFLVKSGRRHYVILSPSRPQLEGHQQYDPLVRQALSKHSIVFSDLNQSMPPPQKVDLFEKWFVDDVHLSVEGHKVWADKISNILIEQQFVKAPN